MEGQLRAKPIECRDDGVVWQMPDGSIKLQAYADAKKAKAEPEKKLPQAPPSQVRKGTIAHAALELLEKHGALRTMDITIGTGRHRTSILMALKNLESTGDVNSRLSGGHRVWRITTQGKERFADRDVIRVRAHSGRVVLGIVARAHGPIDTFAVIERAAGYGVPRKTVKWTLAALRNKQGLLRSEKRSVLVGRQPRPVCFWTLTDAGHAAHEWVRKTERRAA